MRRLTILLVSLLTLSAIVASCSSEGGGGAEESGGPTTAADGGSDDTTDEGGGDDGDDGGTAADPNCDDLLSVDEATELFGREAQVGEDSMAVAGGATLSCIYETADEDDPNAATHLLQLNIWPGKSYYAPDMAYPDHEVVADLGDEAYVDASRGVAAGYLEGDVAVMIDYSIIDLSDPIETADAKADAVVELLRAVQDRMPG